MSGTETNRPSGAEFSSNPGSASLFPFGKTLKDVFSIMWGRKGILLSLLGLSVLFLILMFLPFLGFYREVYEMNQAGLNNGSQVPLETIQRFQDFLSYAIKLFFFVFLFGGLGFSIMYAVWSRASILKRANLFEGGIKALLLRGLRVFWRTICVIGWSFLIMIPLMILWGIVMSTIDFSDYTAQIAQNLFPSLPWQFYVMYAFLVPVFLVLIFAFNFSIHGEARDYKLPIHTSFSRIGRHFFKGLGLSLILMLIFSGWIYVANFFFFKDLMTPFTDMTATSPPNLSDLFSKENIILYGGIELVEWIFSGLGSFSLVTLGAIYASKLVPELKV